MKKVRIFSLAMVLLLAFASFAACGPVVDPDITTALSAQVELRRGQCAV